MFVSLVSAGEIYGFIKKGDRPVGKGIKVVVKCGNRTDTTLTDKYGSYSINVPSTGKCTLTVHDGDQEASIEAFSYTRPVRFDLLLEKNDSKNVLRRTLSGQQRKGHVG